MPEIKPKNKVTAIKLFAAADKLKLPSSVVGTSSTGFIVPDELAAEYEKAEKADAEKAAAPVKKTTRKAAAKAKAEDPEEGKD